MQRKIKIILLLCFIPVNLIAWSGPVGWASVNANGQDGTTGGLGGEVVTVNNMSQLITYAGSNSPYNIQIEGMIAIAPKGRYINVRSDKTLVGIGKGAGITGGGFRVGDNMKNIIFQNLTISDTFVEGDWDGKEQDWDGIQIKGTCHHIWIDHCTFLRQGDGAVDITNGANYITVSNSKFGENNKASLIGSSDTDSFRDRYKVTMHHNWFNETTQRHPRVRFGMVHLFNNYYYNMGGYGREMSYANSNGYGIGVGVGAQIVSEHNYFERVVNPTDFYDNSALPGFIVDRGSYFINSGTMKTAPDGINWDPADYYEYTLDPAVNVKDIVLSRAGADQLSTGIRQGLVNAPGLNVHTYPNPFYDQTQLVLTLSEPGVVTITIRDLAGRSLSTLSQQVFGAGKTEVTIQRQHLKSGIYLLQVETNQGGETIKIFIR